MFLHLHSHHPDQQPMGRVPISVNKVLLVPLLLVVTAFVPQQQNSCGQTIMSPKNKLLCDPLRVSLSVPVLQSRLLLVPN